MAASKGTREDRRAAQLANPHPWWKDPAKVAARSEKMRQSDGWKRSIAQSRKGGKIRPDGRVEVYWRGRYRARSRVVMEMALGRVLDPIEHVHHKNAVVDDDRIENLEVMLRGEHTRHHAADRRAKGVRTIVARCKPGCTCRKHKPRERYWSAARPCPPGCTCGRHRLGSRQ